MNEEILCEVCKCVLSKDYQMRLAHEVWHYDLERKLDYSDNQEI